MADSVTRPTRPEDPARPTITVTLPEDVAAEIVRTLTNAVTVRGEIVIRAGVAPKWQGIAREVIGLHEQAIEAIVAAFERGQ